MLSSGQKMPPNALKGRQMLDLVLIDGGHGRDLVVR
jgi:hypothetical protein